MKQLVNTFWLETLKISGFQLWITLFYQKSRGDNYQFYCIRGSSSYENVLVYDWCTVVCIVYCKNCSIRPSSFVWLFFDCNSNTKVCILWKTLGIRKVVQIEMKLLWGHRVENNLWKFVISLSSDKKGSTGSSRTSWFGSDSRSSWILL